MRGGGAAECVALGDAVHRAPPPVVHAVLRHRAVDPPDPALVPFPSAAIASMEKVGRTQFLLLERKKIDEMNRSISKVLDLRLLNLKVGLYQSTERWEEKSFEGRLFTNLFYWACLAFS